MKKEAIVILFIIFGVVISTNVIADEFGCCSNPGAGDRTCTNLRWVSRDNECCPNPTQFPNYYKSPQNPNNPTDNNDCITNFFHKQTDCGLLDACALGCCCSALGWQIVSEAQCKGTGQVFHKGQTNCNQICAVPQCNDNLDNDNNGCADYNGGDTGCFGSEDTEESGGICSAQPLGCNNPNYIPKLSNLEITQVRGQRKFLLKWQDECSENVVSYEILRCKESGCSNFAPIGITNTNSFEDASGDLLFDTTYTYQVKAKYSLQTATPTITKSANLGNLECWSQLSPNNFCIHEPYYNKYKDYLASNFPNEFRNFADGVKSKFGSRLNKAFSCDAANKLIQQTACSSTQVCIVNNNVPSCLAKSDCKPTSNNPFGLFYTLESCENNKYCFYDKSHSTVDSCFSCDSSMSCYDYRTEGTCIRDNCRAGNCKWKSLAGQIGIGVCVSTIESNCQWCEGKGTKTLENLRAFNEIFDLCTEEKSNALSEGAFKCYFSSGHSKSCSNIVCPDYESVQCGIVTHDENNRITNTIADECGLKVCQNFNDKCSKNTDGDSNADCNNIACENDYFAPNTTLLPITKKGVVDSLIIQIYDKTSVNSSVVLKTSQDHATFLCVEPCGQQGHPYDASTTSRMIILSNLNAFDSNNGNKLLTLSDGVNIVRYYSQDPAKNIGEIKRISIEVHSNTAGPKVFAVNVTDGSKVLDKIYTSNQKPTIEVQFFEPATVTFARLVNKKTSQIVVSFQPGAQLSNKALFEISNVLPNDEYTFELNAKNEKNIPMDPPLSQVIIIDNSKPKVVVSILNGTIFNTSIVPVKITFEKEVIINSIKLNSEEIKNEFTTSNNKEFAATLNLADGNKKLEIQAADFAKNSVKAVVEFVIDAIPLAINLVNPRFGIARASTFNIEVETDNNAECKFSLDTNYEFKFMESFTITYGTLHKILNFNKIASGDTGAHKLYVRCKDQRGESSKSFDISVDTTLPVLKNKFAYPNPVIEIPSRTTLTIEADEPVICKFSAVSQEFNAMEGKFEGFDNNTFKIINKQLITLANEGDYLYYVICKNKAGLNSETTQIPFKVDLGVPISIISHTPDYFNSTNAILAIETNKEAQCQFSETDQTAKSGQLFGAPGYSHTKNIISTQGKHKFYVICKDQYLGEFSGAKTIIFTIDTTPPIMLFVNDTSTFELFPEKTCLTDRLRVKWLGEDKESGVKEYFYSLVKKINNQPILVFVQSFTGGEWVWVENLDLEDNAQYFFRLKANNHLEQESNTKDSDGITVDTSACRPKPTCGDSLINQHGEQCDGATFGSVNSCTQYTNFIGGTLGCTNDCKLDTSSCTKAPDCSNGVIDPGEACDGTSFGSIKTCSDYSPSLTGGTLKCTFTCQLDTSACVEAPKCGNGFIDKGESCDGTNFGSYDGACKNFNTDFTGGNLKCANNCQINTSGCQGTKGTCGDNVVNIGEACDGELTTLCSKYNPSRFINGTLKCADCQLDTSACVEAPKCGNGVVEKSESCDKDNFGKIDNKCITYSSTFIDGILKCKNNCQLDTSGCTKTPTCGNNRLDTGEFCDGTNFGNISDLSCSRYSSNFISGNIKCASCGISTDDCVSKPQPKCGDGLINQPGEECDRETFGKINSCNQYTNFVGGNLRCGNNCKLDISGCVSRPTCGNGQLDPSESCDDTKFGVIGSCVKYNLSFSGGNLLCNSKCELDTSSCIEAPKCGNGFIDKGESCDGTNLGPLSGRCIDYSPSTFSGGGLSCSSNCQLDTTKCQGIQGICGDNTINIGEDCDGANFGQIKTCTDVQSFTGGNLLCNPTTCKLDTSKCIEKPKCGNGKIDAGESCDGTNLGPLSSKCVDYSIEFISGGIKCANECKLDTSGCTKTPTCGNNRLDTGELCDGTNFGNISDLSCTSYSSNFVSGTLVCRNCKISTKDCRTNETTLLITCKDRGDCELNEPCIDNSNCESRFCSNGRCAAAACNDETKNQGETDIDCGGPCSKCQLEKACNLDNDCQSNSCKFGFCKVQESCSNGKFNPGETDIDCGGSCPAKCSEGKNCNANEDCEESLQCASSLCQRCADNDKNCNGVPDDQEEKGIKDSDNDGLQDEWEIQNGLNPNDPNDADLDSDEDGLSNLEEFNVQKTYGKSTNPNLADTDSDGFSDKTEVDKGTSPVDANDFPKSNLAKIVMFTLGFIVLLSGFGYLAYRIVQKRKEEKFEMPKPWEMPRAIQPQAKQTPLRQREEEIKLREALKKKEEQKEKEREKLFEAFGKEERKKPEEAKMAKPESKEIIEPTKKKKKLKAKAKKMPQKRPKEDVFIKLKEIAKEAKKKKVKRKNAAK